MRRCAFALGLALLSSSTPPAVAAEQVPRVFEVRVAGTNPFAPLAPDESFSDVAALSDGRIVALPGCCGGRRLFELDLQGRAQVLQSELYLEVDERNAILESRDGALLFSERGRVLRRAPAGTTSVVAGTTRARPASGDGGPAVGAGMEPTGLAELADGSLLIADARNHRVRRVDTAGRISTVAGTGVAGSDGDGGPALQARLTRPVALSAYPDGSYLVAHGARQIRVRRVAVDGTITTVAGGGAVDAACSRRPRSATALGISADGFGDVTALGDGSFLLSDFSGLLKVSPQGMAVALTCAPFGSSYRADGRDIYVAGRPIASAFLGDYSAPDVAVDPDGSLWIDGGFGNSALALIATPEATRRLAVAIAPETASAAHRGEIVVASTAGATVELRAYQRRRLVARLAGRVGPGETVLALPERLPSGIVNLRLTARTAGGRRAAHSLRLLGRPAIGLRLAKRFMRDSFYGSIVGEGEGRIRLSQCRRHGRRSVRCRARGVANGDRVRTSYGVRLRRNGVVVLTLTARGRQHSTAVHL